MKMPAEGLMFKPEDFKVKSVAQHRREARAQKQPGVTSGSSRSVSKGKNKLKSGAEDPLAEFYAETKAQAEHNGRAGVRS